MGIAAGFSIEKLTVISLVYTGVAWLKAVINLFSLHFWALNNLKILAECLRRPFLIICPKIKLNSLI